MNHTLQSFAPGPDSIERALHLLDSAMEGRGVAPTTLVVIGGAAVNVLGMGFRPTRDVDVVALVESPGIVVSARPLPEDLRAAARDVGSALDLPEDWLNAGPTDLLDAGLPIGFEKRTQARRYGSRLTVQFIGRSDLIATKLFAAVDQGPGSRHVQDLIALRPDAKELHDAAAWVRTHDDSPGFVCELDALLLELVSQHNEEGGSHG